MNRGTRLPLESSKIIRDLMLAAIVASIRDLAIANRAVVKI